MYYFEIKNKKTQEQATATAKGIAQACAILGWKPQDCKCVYKVKEG